MSRRFSDEDINCILEVIADSMADWYQRNPLTFSEQIFAENIESMIRISLKARLKEVELECFMNL